MDFIKKKAFESQLKKVGKDFGLSSSGPSNPFSSSTAAPRQSDWNTDDSSPDSNPFSTRVAGVFDSHPRNFPRFLNLFYVDRSILSTAARGPVDHVLRVLGCLTGLLVLNLFTNALFVGIDGGDHWVNLLIGGIVAVLVVLVELFVFDTAFRGAYRTSTNLRQRYIGFATGNIILFTVYAFLGVSFFNGWTEIVNVNANSESEREKMWKRTFVVIESLGWTFLVPYNMYTMFEFYHLYQSRAQGLSQAALAAAAGGESGGGEARVMEEGGAGRATRSSEVQEIRDRYRTEDLGE